MLRAASTGRRSSWNPYWDRAFRYDLIEVGGRVTNRTSADAVAEDRTATATAAAAIDDFLTRFLDRRGGMAR
jgi:hypothetical protein